MSQEIGSKEPREKIHLEIKPFNKEELNQPATFNHIDNGSMLPIKLELFPKQLLGLPIYDLGPRPNEKTFCAVSSRFKKLFLHRFSASSSLCIFPPWSIMRRTAVFISVNQYFNLLMILTILTNCVFLALNEPVPEVEFAFLIIYTGEMIVKVLAMGFIMEPYTYLRSPWNWLDFLVIVSSLLTSLIGNLAPLRALRVLRALKTISIVPGLKIIINALLKSMRQLGDAIMLSLFCMMVLALFGLQVYRGDLRNKCVLEAPPAVAWSDWVSNPQNWLTADEDPRLCGNVTGARLCPQGFVCLTDLGENPNNGFTSFDNILWALLTILQLITLDVWEDVYYMIISIGGPLHLIFFLVVIFFGSFYLMNLMLAVVALSYEEVTEVSNQVGQEEPRGERGSERPRDREQQDPSSQGEHHWPHLCQQFLSRLVSSSVFETSVSLCIVLNTLFLAMEHHGISQGLQQVLQVGNKVFTTFFLLEAVLKVTALGRKYFQSGWNIFDLLIVAVSLLDLGLESCDGLSVMRAVRLVRVVRVLKLAQSWRTMRVLLTIIISTLGGQAYLTLILIILIYIFAVLGMQIFGDFYTSQHFYPDPVPRWNFTDFLHSFMMIFRVLCGEWIEPLWGCMKAQSNSGYPATCMLIFIPALIIGNFVVLNLFLALILNNFSSDILQRKTKGGGEKTFTRELSRASRKISKMVCGKKFEVRIENPEKDSVPKYFPDILNKLTSCSSLQGTWLITKWLYLKDIIRSFVEKPFFEWTVLILIFASSVSLCFEDIYTEDNAELKYHLKILNEIFVLLFTLEMVLKWAAFGIRKYFRSVWTCLDFVIVLVSILSLALEDNSNLTAFRSLRTVRALRPLRAISRWQGMKIVVNALMLSIPSILNVLLVCLVFWLMFAIMGVQFFGGKFFKCLDEDDIRLDASVVVDKADCLARNLTWANSKITFDHVGQAYLALFQVATFNGWEEIMEDAVDVTEVDKQPQYEASLFNYLYFIVFVICGSFFTLNLLIGVIIENFNALKKKYEGGVLEIFLSDRQKQYYTALRKLGKKKPQKLIQRPRHPIQAVFYDISMSRAFEITIFGLIFLNIVTMGIEHYDQSPRVTFVLNISNHIFTILFSLEACVKIAGLRQHYFKRAWNLFDLLLVLTSVVGIIMEDFMPNFPISPTLLRVLRVFRIGRILRLIRTARGIRKLLLAVVISLPALFNIGALLFLITFIYAVIGINLFGHVKHQGVLDDVVNFETFGRSMMLLFRLMTSAGWNDVLDSLMVAPPDCDPRYRQLPNGDCGYPLTSVIYLVSFIIINFMVIINMYIAIILENFNRTNEEEEMGLVEEDLEMFYRIWSRFDPLATEFILFSQLSDFIASLEPPLRIEKPNTIAIVSLNLPISSGDKIHCVDVLQSLARYTLGLLDIETGELPQKIDEKLKKQFPNRNEVEIISSTLEWKRRHEAARVIQKFYKGYIAQTSGREEKTEDLPTIVE